MIKLNRDQIQQIIPHRDPFLLIDEIVQLDMDDMYVVGKKVVTGEEYFFKGHFPDRPIMPGVLILEALAQTGACCILSAPQFKGKIALFAKANNVKFKKMVVPGDELILKVKTEKVRANVGISKGEAYVGDELACSAEIVCAVGD